MIKFPNISKFSSQSDYLGVILIPLSTKRLRIVSPRMSGDRTIVTPVWFEKIDTGN